MSNPQQQPPGWLPPPMSGPGAALAVRPHVRWFWIGALIAVLMVGGGVTSVVRTATSTFDAIDRDKAVAVGSSTTVRLDPEKSSAIFVSRDSDSDAFDVRCKVADGSGSAAGVTLKQPSSSFTVTLNSTVWERVFVVKVTTAGKYTMTCATAEPGVEFAPGEDVAVTSFALGLGLGILLIVLGLLSGVLIIVITAVRRTRFRRRMGMAPGGPR